MLSHGIATRYDVCGCSSRIWVRAEPTKQMGCSLRVDRDPWDALMVPRLVRRTPTVESTSWRSHAFGFGVFCSTVVPGMSIFGGVARLMGRNAKHQRPFAIE